MGQVRAGELRWGEAAAASALGLGRWRGSGREADGVGWTTVQEEDELGAASIGALNLDPMAETVIWKNPNFRRLDYSNSLIFSLYNTVVSGAFTSEAIFKNFKFDL